MRISNAQIKTIHTLTNKGGLSDDDYRALLKRETGAASSRDLNARQADHLIATLRASTGNTGRTKSNTAAGRYAPVLQALWIAGHNLGVVKNRDDAALIAFVQRQTGVSHTRFLTNSEDARRAIEALKKWLTREAGVIWPRGTDPAARKMAVLEAIARRLASVGVKEISLPKNSTACDLDAFANRLGEQLRAALAKQEH